jgi:hydrogenase maturation factor
MRHLGALFEIGKASGWEYELSKTRSCWKKGSGRFVDFFGIDPYCSISEGTLVLTCRSHTANSIVSALAKKIKSSVVGELTHPEREWSWLSRLKRESSFTPSWTLKAFYGALEKAKK